MKIGNIEIDKNQIYIDNIKVGCLNLDNKEIEFSEILLNNKLIEKQNYRIEDFYLGSIIEQVKSKLNWNKWNLIKYQL